MKCLPSPPPEGGPPCPLSLFPPPPPPPPPGGPPPPLSLLKSAYSSTFLLTRNFDAPRRAPLADDPFKTMVVDSCNVDTMINEKRGSILNELAVW